MGLGPINISLGSTIANNYVLTTGNSYLHKTRNNKL